MPVIDEFARVPCEQIRLDRTDRQRRIIETKGLKESIRNNGVLNPIIVNKDLSLVAGERRLTACLELGLETIPVRFAEDLDPTERQIIELEENLKRAELHWRDATRAIGAIHKLYTERSAEWTQSQTAEALGLDKSTISMYLKVYQSLDLPRLAIASGLSTAYNMLAKSDIRLADTAISEILESGQKIFDKAQEGEAAADGPGADGAAGQAGPGAHGGPNSGFGQGPAGGGTYSGTGPGPSVAKPGAPVEPRQSILNTSFLTWAPTYKGPKFNFIHCDFPYGIDAFAGSKAASGANSSADMGDGGVAAAQKMLYDDRPEVYWELLECLCLNLDNFMSHSGHLMFWFSMKHYTETLEFFSRFAPSLVVNPTPLVWVKSDNKGVIPDPKRGPRQIYETALIASREDRLIVRPVANAYCAPSDKTFHHSTKPEPMLRFFFAMFVDDTTRLLDPTCGSGSALRAAESLNARDVLGLELDTEHYTNAQIALRKFRALRST